MQKIIPHRIDVDREELLRFSAHRLLTHPVCRSRAGGKGDPSKPYRLRDQGIATRWGRVLLPAVKLPNGWHTSLQALEAFVAVCSYGPAEPSARTPGAAASALAQAESELAAAGI